MIIRELKKEDLPQVILIENVAFSSPWSKIDFEAKLKSPNSKFYIAEVDGKVVGYIGLDIILNEGHITNLAVHKDFQRKGIAKILVQKVLDCGLKNFILEVRESNIAAQNLYRSFGFEIIGRRKGYYSDSHEDAIIMKKSLKNA